MPDAHARPARVVSLDAGYRREVRTLLHVAYRQEPSYRYLLDAHRFGYDRRLRVLVREWVRQHFYLQLPALGLLVDDRLVGVALIDPPRRRLGVTDSWAWRLRMMFGIGVGGTRRYLDYQAALHACLPGEQVHLLPLLGLHPDYQSNAYAEQLLDAVQSWCSDEVYGTRGIALDTGNPIYSAFFAQHGYSQIGEINVGEQVERVFFQPSRLPRSTVAV